MRIVFVHGMRQEGKDPNLLCATWSEALDRSWQSAGLGRPDYEVEMPPYGDLLHRLTEEVRGSGRAVTSRGSGGEGEFGALEEEILLEMAAEQGVTPGDVHAELATEIRSKGFANWEVVQATARLLEHRISGFRTLGLRFVRQVDAYLTRDHIKTQVDAVVRPHLASSPDIVIAHSLGSVVAYRNLRQLGLMSRIKLFITLGSPLGIHAVRQWLLPPKERVPEGVRRWVNGSDERDYVALRAALDQKSFCGGIENLTDFRNRHDDAHYIGDYLADPRIARLIAGVAPLA